MALSNVPVFAQTPQGPAVASTSAAHTTLDDISDDTALLFTAGADGAVITSLSTTPKETVTAGVAYLYVSHDGGATGKLLRAKAVAADTVSATDAPAEIDFGYSESSPLRLKASGRLYVAFSLAKLMAWQCNPINN